MFSSRPALSYLNSQMAGLLRARALLFRHIGSSSRITSRSLSSVDSSLDLFEPRPIFSLTGNSRRTLAKTTSGTFAPVSQSAVNRNFDFESAPSLLGVASANLSICDGSDHLPSLRVPNLNETLELLKETIWPITMNSSEFAHALELIEAFSGSAGQKLDLLLRAKASKTKNWLTHDWWIQEAYLKSRAPLVINSNPAMIYPRFPFEVQSQHKLISTMAQLVSGIIDFKLALLQGFNPEARRGQDQFKLNPNLCYNQYRHIFGSTRLPGVHMDSVKWSPLNSDDPSIRVKSVSGDVGADETTVSSGSTKSNNKFKLVLSHRGQFFEIQLNNIDNEQDRIETLQNIFSKIIDYSMTAKATSGDSLSGVGILTADRRDNWAHSISMLNSESLRAIQEAHLMVSLDTISNEPEDKFLGPLLSFPSKGIENENQRIEALSRQVLHSDRANVGNRWFDKSLQLIVVTDENVQQFIGAGINYEHSVAEAMVVTKLIEYSYDKTIKQKNFSDQQFASGAHRDHSEMRSNTSARYRQLKLVDSNRQAEIESVMSRARQDFGAQLDQFDLSYFHYSQYGSSLIKSWRFSPDSWIQVAIQLAHFQLHKRLGPCYESASTRQFAYGRTETIRSLTKDVAQFCQSPTTSTLQKAIVSHKSYAKAANNAAAIDRALLAYRLIFNELKSNTWSWGLPTFDDPNNSLIRDDGNGDFQRQGQATKLRYKNLENTSEQPNGREQVDLNDLFSEKELNILSTFFNNELIERSKKFALSTSQVSSVHKDICMSYGPLLADGYGCCYNISDQQIVAAITANSSNQSFSCEVQDFSESLKEALDKMRDIVDNQQQQRSKSTLI